MRSRQRAHGISDETKPGQLLAAARALVEVLCQVAGSTARKPSVKI
jgi:hypothetical protein